MNILERVVRNNLWMSEIGGYSIGKDGLRGMGEMIGLNHKGVLHATRNADELGKFTYDKMTFKIENVFYRNNPSNLTATSHKLTFREFNGLGKPYGISLEVETNYRTLEEVARIDSENNAPIELHSASSRTKSQRDNL